MDTKKLLYADLWNHVDDTVQYISTDFEGWIFHHTVKPTIDIDNGCFISEEDNYDGYIDCDTPDYNPYKGDWELSLEERPNSNTITESLGDVDVDIDINKKCISSYTFTDYKLVAIVPTFEQLDAIKTCCEAMRRAQLSDLEAHGVYKAILDFGSKGEL